MYELNAAYLIFFCLSHTIYRKMLLLNGSQDSGIRVEAADHHLAKI